MEVLGEKVSITNGEAFAIIRANRDLRNLKCLPHFHMQSICSSSTSGSSAQQALRQKHMFSHRNNQFAAEEVQSALVGSTSIIAEGQIHNAVAHTEIKVLRYLRNERVDFGASSLLLSHLNDNKGREDKEAAYGGGKDDDDDADLPTAAASTSLGVLDGVEGSFAPGKVGGSSSTPALFYYQNTAKNVATLSADLSEATLTGQMRMKALLSELKGRVLSAQGLLDMVKQAVWKSKVRLVGNDGMEKLVSQSDTSLVDLEGELYLSSSSAIVRKFKSVSDSTLASAIAAFLGHANAETGVVDEEVLKSVLVPLEKILSGDGKAVAGLRTRPNTVRDIVNLRNSLAAVAHVASVMHEQVAALTQLASVLANLAVSSAVQGSTTAGVLREVARKSQQLTDSKQSSPGQVGVGGASISAPLGDSASALPHPMSIYRRGPLTPSLGPMGGLDETSQSPPPSLLHEGDYGDMGNMRDEIEALDAVLLNVFCGAVLQAIRRCAQA